MRRWWLAALLSILLPGLGQTYNGQAGKGACFFLGLRAVYWPAACWLIVRRPSFASYVALAVGAAIVGLWMIGDAIVSARRIGDRFVPKRYNRIPIYLAIVVAAVLASVALDRAIRVTSVKPYKVSSGAMRPSLLGGDHIFVQKRPASIERGDIVVYEFPEDPRRDFIHRVIGLPGDTVEIREKSVLVNGTPLSEPYVQFAEGKGPVPGVVGGWSREILARVRDNMAPIRVPAEKYFLMGDNRDRSYDSRFWGPVDRSKVKGVAVSIYFSWDNDARQARWSRIGMPIGQEAR